MVAIIQLRKMFSVELAVILGVGLASIPSVLPEAEANSVMGGGRKCVTSSQTFDCAILANNGANCKGTYTVAKEEFADGMSKQMLTAKWC